MSGVYSLECRYLKGLCTAFVHVSAAVCITTPLHLIITYILAAQTCNCISARPLSALLAYDQSNCTSLQYHPTSLLSCAGAYCFNSLLKAGLEVNPPAERPSQLAKAMQHVRATSLILSYVKPNSSSDNSLPALSRFQDRELFGILVRAPSSALGLRAPIRAPP